MAATNVKVLNPGDKVFLAARAIGEGAPVAPDALITDTKQFPQGSEYLDVTNRIIYRRTAEAGVIGDWAKTAALTAHT